MDIKEIKKKINSLTKEELADFIHQEIEEAYESGHEDGCESVDTLGDEDENEENINFCLKELKEGRERGLSMDEIIQDLTIRSCRFIPTIGLTFSAIKEATKQHHLFDI